MKNRSVYPRLLCAGFIIAGILHINASVQQVISIRAGLVTYTAGCVYLDDQPVKCRPDSIAEFSDGMQLRTEEGLAEVQAGTRTFLRANRRTQIQMENYSPADAELRLKRGSILIEIIENNEDNIVGIRFGDALIQLKEEGLYRVDADRAELRVYTGKSIVKKADRKLTVKGGKAVCLRTFSRSKFDRDIKDGFHYWAAYRSFVNAMGFKGMAQFTSNWEALHMDYFRNEHYRLRFRDKDGEGPNPPVEPRDWHEEWERELAAERMEEIRQMREIMRRQIEDRKKAAP